MKKYIITMSLSEDSLQALMKEIQWRQDMHDRNPDLGKAEYIPTVAKDDEFPGLVDIKFDNITALAHILWDAAYKLGVKDALNG